MPQPLLPPAFMTDPTPVSFTVRRPSPISRPSSSGFESDESSFKVPALPRHLSSGAVNSPLARSGANSPQPKTQSRTYYERDSSDEEEEPTDELVTGFDQFGVQRCVSHLAASSARQTDSQLTSAHHHLSRHRLHERKKQEGPLVIAPLQNKDWRETARKRRTSERFIPGAGNVGTGADGSVGGLGTRDSINSGPQHVGLQLSNKRVKLEHDASTMNVDSSPPTPSNELKQEETEDENQRAIRALIAGDEDSGMELPAIPVVLSRTLSEAEALKQDVAELPDSADLNDYERVPVSQFGAAMLRGMGWTEDKAASRNGKSAKGNVQPWLPEQRPALLGIGAKEREILDDGDPKKKKRGKQDLRYVPLVKKEKDGAAKDDVKESVGDVSLNDRDKHRDRDYEHSRSDRSSRDYRSDRNYRSDRDYRDRDRDRDYKDVGRSRSERDRYNSEDRRLDDGKGKDRRSASQYDDRRRDDRSRADRRDRDREYERRRDERGSSRERNRQREKEYR